MSGGFFGCTCSSQSGGGGTPAAPVSSVQFNNAGAFGGSVNLEWDNVAQVLRIVGKAGSFAQLNLVGDAAGAPGLSLVDTATGQQWYVLASGALLVYARDGGGNPVDIGLQITQDGAGHVTLSELAAGGKTIGINSAGAITLNGSVGTAGQTIVSAGVGAPAAWGGAGLGVKLAFASPAGVINAAPAGFATSTGRLIVTLPGGAATWTTLTPGIDGQLLLIGNEDAANTLTLPAANWGGVADLLLPPKARVLAYYDGTAVTPNWKLTQ